MRTVTTVTSTVSEKKNLEQRTLSRRYGRRYHNFTGGEKEKVVFCLFNAVPKPYGTIMKAESVWDVKRGEVDEVVPAEIYLGRLRENDSDCGVA